MIEKIISGGQTGVDRAALDIGLELGIPIGGMIPKGRRTEDGPLDPKYPLRETKTTDYQERTILNVENADATLIFTTDRKSPGTKLTINECRRQGKPHMVVELYSLDLSINYLVKIGRWIQDGGFKILNVAGSRESKAPGIYQFVKDHLRRTLTEMGE